MQTSIVSYPQQIKKSLPHGLKDKKDLVQDRSIYKWFEHWVFIFYAVTGD